MKHMIPQPMETTPKPGSDDAIARGCTCPVLDNARGRGDGFGTKNSTR